MQIRIFFLFFYMNANRYERMIAIITAEWLEIAHILLFCYLLSLQQLNLILLDNLTKMTYCLFGPSPRGRFCTVHSMTHPDLVVANKKAHKISKQETSLPPKNIFVSLPNLDAISSMPVPPAFWMVLSLYLGPHLSDNGKTASLFWTLWISATWSPLS